LQGFIWPYYLLDENEIDNNANAKFSTQKYFQNSLIYTQKAYGIEKENINNKIHFFNQQNKYSKAIELRRKAIKNAEKVSIVELRDNISDEIADSYKNDFIKGLKLYFKGLENENESQLNSSTLLLNNFGNIYREWRNE